jgi:8-oxo-dGTP diphosphatase
MPQRIVAAAVIERDGRVLLTQRVKGAHLEGYWEFPGGKVEDGESPEVALARELREECGIDVDVTDILDVAWHRYPEKDVLLLFYDCVIIRGDVQDLGVAAHVWCVPEDLDRYQLPPPDARVISKIKRRSSGGAR